MMKWSCSVGRNGLLSVLALSALSLFSVSGNATAAACKAATSGSTNNNVGPNTSVTASAALTGTGAKSSPLPANGGVYTWSWDSGPSPLPTLTIVSTSATQSASFTTPPATTHYGQFVLRMAVTGSCSPADAATIKYTLINANNLAPVASASASPTPTVAGTLVTLTGAASYDHDNDPIKYKWKQISPASPTMTLSDVHAVAPTFVAPSLGTTTTFTFELEVCEDYPATTIPNPAPPVPCNTTTVGVAVEVPSNHAPVANALTCPESVDEGKPFTLTSHPTDADAGDVLSYLWEQETGYPQVDWPADRTLTEVSFDSAPILGPIQISPMKFKFTVTDDHGASDSSTCEVMVNDKTGPDIVAPNISVEGTSPAGEVIFYDDASASDAVDGPVTLTCIPPSGSTFHVGPATTVDCSAHDSADPANESLASFTVTVTDSTAPDIIKRDDITVQATKPGGADVDYALPSATDLVDAHVDVVCDPAPNSTFALGTKNVVCIAKDDSGNSSQSDFNITVEDTIAPVIDAHDPVTEEATGPNGAVVDYGVIKTYDVVDVDLVATCVPASGTTFALGTTTVTCNATDAPGGNAAIPTTFVVTVEDTTPPTISENLDLTKEATKLQGADVSFGLPTASDLVDENVDVVCSPSSGSTFAFGGPHTVTCTATDDSGNHASSEFTVTVVDTTPPVITDNADISIAATSDTGASVTINALPSATDIFGALVDCRYTTTSLTNEKLSAGTTNFPVGTTTVNCTATDGHGLTSTSSFTVYVHYTFSAFLQPVDNLPTINSVKAGSAIPVKFTLGGNMGLGIFAAGYPKVLASSCASGTPDVIEETVTAGNSSLSYDAGTGKYIYVWKTDKSWVGACRQLKIVFVEGTEASAGFIFK